MLYLLVVVFCHYCVPRVQLLSGESQDQFVQFEYQFGGGVMVGSERKY